MQGKTDGKAVASLVLGIISIVFVFFGTFAFIGIILGIISLVLGIISKKAAPSGLATAGIVLSIIAIALCAISFLACVACVGSLAALGSSTTA